MIALIVISFLVSAIAVQIFMRRARRHARRYGEDMPQRFHRGHVPRLGGAGIMAGRSVRPFLVQSYRRDMGGGVTYLMREVDAPLRIRGRHWGGVRMAYRI